jgi:hypothetical protein
MSRIIVENTSTGAPFRHKTPQTPHQCLCFAQLSKEIDPAMPRYNRAFHFREAA